MYQWLKKRRKKADPVEQARSIFGSRGSGEGARSALERMIELREAAARLRPPQTGFGGLPPFTTSRW